MMMKKIALMIALFLAGINMWAVSTTYTFTSLNWSSKVGTIKTDGKTDGWISDKDATDYNEGRTDAEGRLYSRGVGVKTGTSGAGATSVLEFSNVRRVEIDFCQNSSKGKGTIYVQVGEGEIAAITVNRPETSGQGVYNRQETMTFSECSGHIKFWVECQENGIYINTITVKADNGSPNNPGVSTDVFKLVTSKDALNEGDQVIFGVAKEGINYMMGFYDEANSRNNIFAVKATYDADRQTINRQDECIYTVGIEENGFTFADQWGWYLVASGGNPNKGNNNYLTVWDSFTSRNYGDYGIWNVTISADGSASVKSQGVSRSCYLQYNPSGANNHPIFACYGDEQYAKVAIYKLQETADVTEPVIIANFVNFGTQIIDAEAVSGEKQIEITAYNLSDEIDVSLKNDNPVFEIGSVQLDRDGEPLIIKYNATEPGLYIDTLLLQSGTTKTEVSIMLNVEKQKTIAEAKQQPDLTTCYLNPVVVTKKYDRYIFVEDATGGMLLYDAGNQYGQGLTNGNILTGVCGYKKDYYGNPEITLQEQFSVAQGEEKAPAIATETLTENDVCSYVRLENVEMGEGGRSVIFNGSELSFYDIFNYVGDYHYPTSMTYSVEGIVYFYDKLVFCPSKIEAWEDTGIEHIQAEDNISSKNIFDLTGRKLNKANLNNGIYIVGGKKIIIKN
ncbi:MAG: hypothetical protein MJY95_06210 [Bacteroidaceae bacterium]|nr:hypothetical protein [Bacteroidaceae bacterium]